jgi:hypothetical protein
MTFQKKYQFDFKKIISDKIKYNNALLFVTEFEDKIKKGEISNLGSAYGFRFDEFCAMFSENFELQLITEDHYQELAHNNMSPLNPLKKIEHDEHFYTIQKYAELNYVHLPVLDIDYFSEPEDKITAFKYFNNKNIFVIDNVAQDSHVPCEIDGLTALITIDKNSGVSNELLQQWVINYYLLKDNELIGIVQADLVTSAHSFENGEYFMAMDEDSDFLAGEAHAIISDYLNRTDTSHENINQLYTENFELSSHSGTIHVFNAEIREDYRNNKLLHVIMGSLIDVISNNELCNINSYMDVGFDQNSLMSELSNYENVIVNKLVPTDIDISFISLITINLTLGNFVNLKHLNNQQELITEKNNLLFVESYLSSFEYDLSYINVLDEPPVRIFINRNSPLNQDESLGMLHNYIS